MRAVREHEAHMIVWHDEALQLVHSACTPNWPARMKSNTPAVVVSMNSDSQEGKIGTAGSPCTLTGQAGLGRIVPRPQRRQLRALPHDTTANNSASFPSSSMSKRWVGHSTAHATRVTARTYASEHVTPVASTPAPVHPALHVLTCSHTTCASSSAGSPRLRSRRTAGLLAQGR